MEELKRVPKLRFEEFAQDWYKNTSPIKIVAGNSYSLNEYEDEGFLLVQGLNIGAGKLKLDNPKYLPKSLGGNHVTIEKGDILLGLNRPITNGKLKVCAYQLNEKAILYQRAGKLEFETDIINSNFLYQLLRSDYFLKETNIELVGSDQPYIRSNLFDVVKLWFPQLEEQTKIANFLTAVDAKIANLSEEKSLLENYKKGVIQKIFPSTGSGTPELRFKQDDGSGFPEWETKPLGEIFERVVRKNKENNQNILTISAQQGLVNQYQYFNNSVAAKNVTKYYLLHRDEFAYNKSYSKGYPMGAIKRLTKYESGVVSTLYICFRLKVNHNNSFYEHLFESGLLNNQLKMIAQEGARNHGLLNLSLSDFFDAIDVQFPSVQEQTKIANFLTSLDEKINTAAAAIENAQTFKKGLLQQLFV